MMAHAEVISPGLYSTIQDNGRFGFRKFGVPTSGAMDQQSANLANHLLNNPTSAAVLEMTMVGPKLIFSASSLIVITGADMSPKINEKEISLNMVVAVSKGDILSFGTLRCGLRSYLAVKGGFQTERVMNSHSFYRPVTIENVIKKGDRLPLSPFKSVQNLFASVKADKSLFDSSPLPCFKGPEFDFLESGKTIFTENFSVGNENNRMGYRLHGKPLRYPANYSMLTSAVLPGTIQLTPSGQLIALMRDCQTTGGYPRILQLTQESLDRLGQKKTSDLVSFTLIDQR